MKKYWNEVWKNPFFPLALAFVLTCLIVTQDGGQNAKSRLLAMRTFGETGAFRMDDHIRVTDDWSQAPDGKYYSNKAPGSLILGMPIFYLADKLHQLGEKGFRDERGLRHDPGYFQSTITSFFVQVLPFSLLILACASGLGTMGVSSAGRMFFCLAAMFANTAAIFMKSYFGHGLVASLQLSGLWFLLRRKYFWAGAMFSFSLLCDYGFATQIPGLLMAMWLMRPARVEVKNFALGAIPGAFFWVIYHSLAFGSPVAIASRFQNPTFLEGGAGQTLLWGMIMVPDPHVLWEITLGGARGLVLSQPWLILLLPLLVGLAFRRRISGSLLPTIVFCFLSLAGLLLLNSSFNGWHGGASAGPRYLSGVLPSFALAAGLAFDRLGRATRYALWALLVLALVFRGLVYGSTILAPNSGLWAYYWNELLTRSTSLLRFCVFVVLVGGGWYWSQRRLAGITR